MAKPRVLILAGFGINCDYETEFAFNMASVGGKAKRIHLTDLLDGDRSLEEFQILVFPGGFSFGDDIASGKVMANKLRYYLADSLARFIDDGKLIIGICNGFQILVKANLLPDPHRNRAPSVTLTWNDSRKFEDRWTYLKVNSHSPCVFTKRIRSLYLPVRHGEGKFIPKSQKVLEKLWRDQQIVLQYTDKSGQFDGYPNNPNGSVDNVAGICDASGRIFGLMPHPEGHLFRENHPRWTRETLPDEGMGVQIFRNAVQYVKSNL